MKTSLQVNFLLKLLGVAALYVLFARIPFTYFPFGGEVSVIRPASGLALAVLLLGGRRYAWGIFPGAFLISIMLGRPMGVAAVIASGSTLAALAGSWLLTRGGRFDVNLRSLRDYFRLMTLAGFVGVSISALSGTTALLAAGLLSPETFFRNLLHWWMGDALGIMLLTPLILVWRRSPDDWLEPKRLPEVALVLGLAFLAGQIVFLDWLHDTVDVVAQGYWIFLFIAWAAMRLGTHGVTAILCMTAVQALLSSHQRIGFFANDIAQTQLTNSWFYMTVLSLVGMSLATYFTERKRSEAALRIAAAAFECQEGMFVTDVQQTILRVNSALTRITGYTTEETVGQMTRLFRSGRHDDIFYDAIWNEVKGTGAWQGEIWCRRKNGEIYPGWITITRVADKRGRATHYVGTLIDTTDRKQQEQQRLVDEAAQRDALVSEVHHRIKNNLQGITGVLRQFVQDHPETAEPINQAICQVQNIAVIHGLQGRTSLAVVRLCELTSAIAAEIQSLWQTPIVVDIPPAWIPGIVAEAEAVPLALVLNELIVNAVKHGGRVHGGVGIMFRKGYRHDVIRVAISNTGQLSPDHDRQTELHTGLQLVASLMPRYGASLSREQQGNQVVTLLEFEPPVIKLESKESP